STRAVARKSAATVAPTAARTSAIASGEPRGNAPTQWAPARASRAGPPAWLARVDATAGHPAWVPARVNGPGPTGPGRRTEAQVSGRPGASVERRVLARSGCCGRLRQRRHEALRDEGETLAPAPRPRRSRVALLGGDAVQPCGVVAHDAPALRVRDALEVL